MLRGGLLKKTFLKGSVKISAIRQQFKPISFSHYKSMENLKLSHQSNVCNSKKEKKKKKKKTKKKKTNKKTMLSFVEVYAMNISKMLQLYPPYSF